MTNNEVALSLTPSTAAARQVSSSPVPYESVLRQILPTEERALLLAACLRQGEAAARAWGEFISLVGSAVIYVEEDQAGLREMLPFMAACLKGNAIDPGKEFDKSARAAAVREELRSQIYDDVLDQVLGGLDAAGIAAVLLKGAAVSAMAYPQARMRHKHAIDLLVHPNQMDAAIQVLQSCRFMPLAPGPGAAAHRDFRHVCGLALGLHSRALFLPHFELSAAELRQRRHPVRLRDRTAMVISAEDCLVHVCGHALYSRSRANLRWVCDVFYLLQTPDLNWRRVVEAACRARLALPLLVVLTWMRDFLGVYVPLGYLTELEANARALDSIAAEGIWASLLHSRGTVQQSLGAFNGNPRQIWSFVRFSVLPSVRYMRWKYNVYETWPVIRSYVDRAYTAFARLIRAARLAARG